MSPHLQSHMFSRTTEPGVEDDLRQNANGINSVEPTTCTPCIVGLLTSFTPLFQAIYKGVPLDTSCIIRVISPWKEVGSLAEVGK